MPVGAAYTKSSLVDEQSCCGIFLGLGTNLGDRLENLARALDLLTQNGVRIQRISSVYQSNAILVEDQPDFLNCVALVKTDLSPEQLLQVCLSVEQTMGRVRLQRWGPRLIDVDILLYKNVTLDSEHLRIPHPGLTERAFALLPLLEIAPEVRLPSGELLGRFVVSDMRGMVSLVSPPPDTGHTP